MIGNDTIVAVSSATGRAARMIVRVGGPGVRALSSKLGIDGFVSGAAVRGQIQFDGMVCPAWVYQFASPRSYSGEDILELHIPGNPVLARMLFDWLLKNGARAAEAGEFTARAYFNGKLDLSQAEGVAAIIAARGAEQLSAARKLLAGELARRLEPSMELLADTLAMVEAGIDFSDEGIEFLSGGQIADRVDRVVRQLEELIAGSVRLEKLTHEPTIVLAGRANAGKSTLVNALAGLNRSVVSAVAGTTRDILSVEIVLPRGIVRLVDVAGIEEASDPGEIGEQMRAQALRAIESADMVVVVKDSTDEREEVVLGREADIVVLSKIDLLARNPLTSPECRGQPNKETIRVSAKTGDGLDLLRKELERLAFGSDSAGAMLALTSRHVRALEDAIGALRRAKGVGNSLELLAAELRAGLDSLGSILGVVTPDDVLGRIFSAFCIGK